MKSFNDIRFANSFGRIHAACNAGLRGYHWEHDGVEWSRTRHGHHGSHYSYQCETFVLTRKQTGKTPWVFLYVSETWWDMDGKNVLRNHTWGKMMKGRKPDALAWFKTQEDKLNRRGT